MNLSPKRVLVTGGGVRGRHVVSALERHGCRVVVVRKARHDLTSEPDVVRLFREVRPRLVVHLAAVVAT
jgi:nucleoside-diphosphate-sugar epimerase